MKKDRIIGVGVILTALFFFYQTRMVRIPENLAEPGPRIVPYIAQALMIICGIGMIAESIKKDEEKVFLTKSGWKKLGIAYGALFLYAIGLTFLGFIWATPFMAFALITMLSGENKVSIPKRAVVSIVLTTAFYLVFTKGFGVMLPQGML